MVRSHFRRCTCRACKGGLCRLKLSRDGARKWAAEKVYWRRQLRRRNNRNLRVGRYEFDVISLPYTD
jgi:hypothetical protein